MPRAQLWQDAEKIFVHLIKIRGKRHILPKGGATMRADVRERWLVGLGMEDAG
jgi:hypothetical protein